MLQLLECEILMSIFYYARTPYPNQHICHSKSLRNNRSKTYFYFFICVISGIFQNFCNDLFQFLLLLLQEAQPMPTQWKNTSKFRRAKKKKQVTLLNAFKHDRECFSRGLVGNLERE